MLWRFHSPLVRTYMASKPVRRRNGAAVKEIVHPPPTRRPIDGRRYGGQWVAIMRREIIDSDPSLDALCDRLESRGLEEKAALMKVPSPGVWNV